jgi:hypothetical protein
MRVSWATSVVVAVLSASAARADQEFTFDQAAPVSSDGQVELTGEAGPLQVLGIVIRDVPGPEKILEDTHEWNHAKPRPIVTLANPVPGDAKARLDLTLEGNVYMKCSRAAEVDGHTKKDTYNLCVSVVMRTMDWPKVTRVHLVARIQVEDEDDDD